MTGPGGTEAGVVKVNEGLSALVVRKVFKNVSAILKTTEKPGEREGEGQMSE